MWLKASGAKIIIINKECSVYETKNVDLEEGYVQETRNVDSI